MAPCLARQVGEGCARLWPERWRPAVAVVGKLTSNREALGGQNLDLDFHVHGEPAQLVPEQPGMDGPPVQRRENVPRHGGVHRQDPGRARAEVHLLVRPEMIGPIRTISSSR